MNYKIEKITEDFVITMTSANEKCTYMNSTSNREMLKNIFLKEDYDKVINKWGDELTIPDLPQVSEEVLLKRKNDVIKDMSEQCNKMITGGFDIVLSNNKSYHFSLTLDDQANLSTLATDMLNGSTLLPYHSDGEQCQFYSVEDMTKIITTAKNFKTYHITYFNSLREYINSLEKIKDVNNIYYGTPIPDEYQSDVLKTIIEGMNDSNV